MIFWAVVAADPLHPLLCWKSPGEAGESPGQEASRVLSGGGAPSCRPGWRSRGALLLPGLGTG